MELQTGIALILFAGLVCLIVGMILLVMHNSLKRSRINDFEDYVHHSLLPDIQKTMVDVMDDAMDSIPYKIMDAKQILKESDVQWTQ